MAYELLKRIGFTGVSNLRDHIMPVPSKPIYFPSSRRVETQVQQIKVIGQTPTATNQNTTPTAVSPNTQGVPQNLISMSVVRSNTSATTRKLTVSFQRNTADQNYSSANIY